MLLTPAAVRPWTAPDSRNRPWPSHGAMMIRRREALTALYAAYGSWVRLALGALAWALAVGGTVLVGHGIAADDEGPRTAVGAGLLVAAAVLGALVVTAGSHLARAAAAWWTLATAVTVDGGRTGPGTGDPQTQRAHEDTRTQDRASGSGELWRMPLLPRTVVALLVGSAALVLLVQVGLGYSEAVAPYADTRGPWLARLGAAAVCVLTTALTVGGLRRIHRARMHRVEHAEAGGAHAPAATSSPALGTGAIVVGGRPPAGASGAPPAWAVPRAPAPDEAHVPADGAATHASVHDATAHAPAHDAAGHAPAHDAAGHGAPAHVPAPDGEPVRLRLSDGRELGAGTTLIGRSPRPRPDERADVLLAVDDERVSKTHLTVRLEPGRAVVVDRGSTNGTVVHRVDGTSRPLSREEPYVLADGDVVVLGGTTLTVGDVDEDVEHTVLRNHADEDVEHTVLRGNADEDVEHTVLRNHAGD